MFTEEMEFAEIGIFYNFNVIHQIKGNRNTFNILTSF